MIDCVAKMKLKLDDWQKDVLNTKGNIVLRSGRQVGKSTVVSIKAVEYAVNHPNKTVIVIANVERQALHLFEKILSYFYDNHKDKEHPKYRPTRTRLSFSNESTIHCLPAGIDGRGIRGYTVDLLIVDEAAFVEDAVWSAVTPMLAVTKGSTILLSTPFGRRGYFYQCFSDDTYKNFHISAEDCPRKSKSFLAQEKKRMTKLQYAQEYLGEFVDELRQFFPSELIHQCMLPSANPNVGNKYLGVDVARMGRDDSVLFSLSLHNDILHQLCPVQITKKTLTTETTRMILANDKRHNYKRIYIDSSGMGVAVFDPLREHAQTKRKVVPIENSRRSLDKDRDGQKKALFKEDLYNNLLVLMETNRLHLFEDADTALSLKCIQADYTDSGQLKIFGNYTHIAEALIRAAWCIKDKSLNMFLHY